MNHFAAASSAGLCATPGVVITHFYGDTHLGHAGIIEYASRPFPNLDAMHEALWARYVERVGPNDRVAWFGDVTFATKAWTWEFLQSLPGHKILIRGNHDGSVSRCLQLGFDMVVDQLYMNIRGYKVTCCHFPPAGHSVDTRYLNRRPPKPGPGEFVVHGHSHQPYKLRNAYSRCINVCLEAWDYYPVSVFEISDIIARHQTSADTAPQRPQEVEASYGVPEPPAEPDPGS